MKVKEQRKPSRAWSIIYLAIVCLNLLLFFLVAISWFFRFKYPYIHLQDWNGFLLLSLFCVLPAILSALCFVLRKFIRLWLRIVTIVLIGLVSLFSGFCLWLSTGASPFGSQTSNLDHYLKVDSFVEGFTYDYFPESIPASAENTQYYYRFRYYFGKDFDIYLQLILPQSEFDGEKARIIALYPDVSVSEYKGGITKYEIRAVSENDWTYGYHYEFVTFSETSLTVTYVIAYCSDSADGSIIPYCCEIENHG
ncbi:MAG: hypothetical protein FWE69_05525 [Clostridiales bacterium]|nr:hypothetical protein [Clostridiales bacterium]